MKDNQDLENIAHVKQIIDDWLTGIDKNMVSGSLFVDLSKAFDLVNHKLLIDKLQLYNIDIPRFSSYLQTYFSGAMSDKKAVISGVPQGSVLGPILFLIYNLYIHDLPLSLTRTLWRYIYLLKMLFNPLPLTFKMFFLGVMQIA